MSRAFDTQLLEWEEQLSGQGSGLWLDREIDSIEGRPRTKPIRRRRRSNVQVLHPGIPGAENRWFPSQGQAKDAALLIASRLGPGYRIDHHHDPRLGLPHYHVVNPQGQKISGHFFYGKRLPHQIVRGRPGRMFEEPAPPANFPKGLTLVQHTHLARPCSTGTSNGTSTVMSPSSMNPGFIMGNDQIQFDDNLDKALINLLVDDKDYRKFLAPLSIKQRWPSAQDRIRVALVDLTGNKICRPGYAGWGSTTPMRAASTAKIGIVFAVHQLLFDLREIARAGSLRTTTDLVQRAEDAWKKLICKPDINWLFTIDELSSPLKIEMSPKLLDHLQRMVDTRFSNESTPKASELILRVGFEYIASVLWQSGLRHPTRAGLWFGSTFCPGPPNAKPNAKCHVGGCPVEWAKDPLAARRIYLSAMSVATFFTLLAQGRLVSEQLSRAMESLLATGCSWLYTNVPSGARVRAAKCGIVSIPSGPGQTGNFRHDAGLIENGTSRYVLVYLTRNLPMPDSLRIRLVRDLDRLIKDNNP